VDSLLRDYLPILVLLAVAVGLGLVLILAAALIAVRNPDPEKLSAYECGFNAFDDAQGFANMYQLSSRINHSCVPNCLRFAGEENQVKVVTRQPIEKGQKIFISYLDCAKGGSSAGRGGAGCTHCG
jgi:hypothetical protein